MIPGIAENTPYDPSIYLVEFRRIQADNEDDFQGMDTGSQRNAIQNKRIHRRLPPFPIRLAVMMSAVSAAPAIAAKGSAQIGKASAADWR